MAKKTISITEARSELFNIADEVQKPDTQYVLTREGKPAVVLLSAEEFDSIMETIEILSDPQLLKEIKEAEKEIERGEYVDWEDLKKELNFPANQSLVLRDQGKRKYRVRSKKKE